ncbi:hypothetical protein Hypma_011508 [Hypsizygus marmoreus]|uniref:MARVEL domain-containing protein n=1 Tax=Hypsizygus marmoreus TaxID=39966 RepID=A0A369JNK8_HYPMA|nr:hypothetical protein Hypma_011508 [Hypsizygus marmoreus]
MQSILSVLRYVVFGFFIICSATIASVAVWNNSLAQSAGWNLQVDIYLIFLGCFGLALIFAIIFVELAYRHAFTGRVWFECVWVGLSCCLHLAGAVAVTSIVPTRMCSFQLRRILSDSCISTHVLMAFTWIITTILLLYFFLLVTASLVHVKHDSRIWHCYVHKFPWSDCSRPLASTSYHASTAYPTSPSPFPQFLKKMPSIVAPKPQRPAPATIYAQRSGLGSEYEIESFSTPVPGMDRPAPHFPAMPAGFPIPHNTPQVETYQTPSLYPQYMESAFISQPLRVQLAPQPPTQRFQAPTSPSPLGDWPRPNAVMLPPSRARRNRPIPPAMGIDQLVVGGTPSSPTGPRPRPSGPRRRSDGEPRSTRTALDSSRTEHGRY